MGRIALSLIAWVLVLLDHSHGSETETKADFLLQAAGNVIDSDNMSCIGMHLSGYLGFWHLQCATIHGCVRAKCLLNEISVAKDAFSSTDRSSSFASIGRFLLSFE